MLLTLPLTESEDDVKITALIAITLIILLIISMLINKTGLWISQLAC